MYGSDAKYIHSSGVFDSYQLVANTAKKTKVSPTETKVVRNPVTGQKMHVPKAVRDPVTGKTLDARKPPYELADAHAGPDEQIDVPQAYFDITIPVGNGMRAR